MICYKEMSQQKSDDNLFIGTEAKNYLEANAGKLKVKALYSPVRKSYSAACDYMLRKFPYKDEVLTNAAVADISTRAEQDFSFILFFLNRYPFLLPGVKMMRGLSTVLKMNSQTTR
jgi:hypothetical protein